MKLSKKMIAGIVTAAALLIGIIGLLVMMPKSQDSAEEQVAVNSGETLQDAAGADAGETVLQGQAADTASGQGNGSDDTSGNTETADPNGTAGQENTAEQNPVTGQNDTAGETSEITSETTSETTPETTTETTSTPTPVSATGTPVAIHGKLSVRGSGLVDKNGNEFQIQGVSTHGIAWFPEYVNKAAFQTIRDEWGANCIRLAMYSAEYGGYCTGGNQADLKRLVNDGVSYATELGMYVIIDWHIMNQDGDPNTHKTEALAFFKEMSAKYADYDNVIYEICNEPNGGTQWSSIKSYALEVIPVIKANNPDAIIIVGTPNWSQDVDAAAKDPITGYSNIMYTIHFYADTHRDGLRQKMQVAIDKGLALFCTEFGICDASGSGANNITEGNKWISALDNNNISYCIWNLSNKAETSSLIQSGCNKTSGWTTNELTEAGKWYVGILDSGVAPGSTGISSDTGNNNNSNNNNNNNNNSSTPAVTASSANTQVTIANSGGWSSGNGNCSQYTVTIKNTGSTAVNNWKVTVNFSGNVTLDQSWSGSFSASGSSVTITPVDFNREIAAGQSVEVGFIISYSGNVGTPTVSID